MASNTAIAMAIARLMFAPKFTRVAATVTSVSISKLPPVAHSTRTDAIVTQPVLVIVDVMLHGHGLLGGCVSGSDRAAGTGTPRPHQ